MKAIRLSAALFAAMLFVAGEARASFTYTVAPVNTDTAFGAGSHMIVTAFNNGASSGTLSGTQIINVAQITQTSTTVAPATDTGDIALAPLVVTITNAGGSSAFTVNGTIHVTRSDTTGAVSSFVPGVITPVSFNLGGFVYTLSGPSYTAPTIGAGGNGNGSLSYTITETPEPSSLALMGIGVASVVGLVARRRMS